MKCVRSKAHTYFGIEFDGAFVVHCVNRVAREGC